MRRVALLESPFDPNPEIEMLSHACPDAGGIATFVGKVRAGGGVEALELSHYERLTLPEMVMLAQEANKRWNLEGLLMLHRIGLLQPGEPIVCVSAASRHRRDAIESVDFCMDHLKSAAWFWKREKRADGWRWIEPREQDFSDRDRWTQ